MINIIIFYHLLANIPTHDSLNSYFTSLNNNRNSLRINLVLPFLYTPSPPPYLLPDLLSFLCLKCTMYIVFICNSHSFIVGQPIKTTSEGLKALQTPRKTWCRALLVHRFFTSSRFILRSLVPGAF